MHKLDSFVKEIRGRQGILVHLRVYNGNIAHNQRLCQGRVESKQTTRPSFRLGRRNLPTPGRRQLAGSFKVCCIHRIGRFMLMRFVLLRCRSPPNSFCCCYRRYRAQAGFPCVVCPAWALPNYSLAQAGQATGGKPAPPPGDHVQMATWYLNLAGSLRPRSNRPFGTEWAR